MTDYTKLIERLYNSHDAETLCADAALVIEALQKEVSTLDVLLEECKMDWSGDVTQLKAEHKHEVEALQAENEWLKGLLSEVSGNFTRDDDLPDGLLGRIDTAIKRATTPETGNAATPEASAITVGYGQQAQEPVSCGCCNGIGWVVRDADIGTDQECFCCNGSGKAEIEPAPKQAEPAVYIRKDHLQKAMRAGFLCHVTPSLDGLNADGYVAVAPTPPEKL
jgi:hypothetical protein